jgi:peptide chain release factor 1
MLHRPTGIQVFVNGRNQQANRREALKILTTRVRDLELQKSNAEYGELRKRQLANKGRGHKIRTYNFLNDRAVDHRTGKKTSVKRAIDHGSFETFH